MCRSFRGGRICLCWGILLGVRRSLRTFCAGVVVGSRVISAWLVNAVIAIQILLSSTTSMHKL